MTIPNPSDDTKIMEQATKNLEEIMLRLKAGDAEALKMVHGLGDTMGEVIPALERTLKRLEVQKRASQIVEQIDRRVRHTSSLNPDFAEPKFTILSKRWKWFNDDEHEWPNQLVLAEWVYDHIEIHFGSWIAENKNWLTYAHVFNHEVLHGIIGKIEAEDNIEHEETHFPMICGLDEMFGYCMAHTNPNELLPMQVFIEETEAFGDSHLNPIRKVLSQLESI